MVAAEWWDAGRGGTWCGSAQGGGREGCIILHFWRRFTADLTVLNNQCGRPRGEATAEAVVGALRGVAGVESHVLCLERFGAALMAGTFLCWRLAARGGVVGDAVELLSRAPVCLLF